MITTFRLCLATALTFWISPPYIDTHFNTMLLPLSFPPFLPLSYCLYLISLLPPESYTQLDSVGLVVESVFAYPSSVGKVSTRQIKGIEETSTQVKR